MSVQMLVSVSIFLESKYLDMKNKNLSRYYNLTTNSLVSTTMELILVNMMLLYKSGRSITTLTTYWKNVKFPLLHSGSMIGLQMTCASAKPHSESIWSFFKVLSVSNSNFLPSICLVFGITPAARLRMAAVSSLWLRDTYWPRCSRPRAHYGLRWRTTTHWNLIVKFRQKLD